MKNLLLKYYVWAQIWSDEDGQDLIEYALIAALIALAAISTMQTVGTKINQAFSKIVSGLST